MIPLNLVLMKRLEYPRVAILNQFLKSLAKKYLNQMKKKIGKIQKIAKINTIQL
jgi:hypothetical protein